jgi:hypothetical protein
MEAQKENGCAVECTPIQNQSTTLILTSLFPTGQAFGISDDAKARQRAVILDALRKAPLSTLEARERLGVLHAPGRVCELRKLGAKIRTEIKTQFDSEGRPHRVGVYILTGGAP